MALDLKSFGEKLRWYRQEHELTGREIAEGTGIPEEKLSDLEAGKIEPTGDEVLILADFFLCDYNYFLSNAKDPALSRLEKLYRRHGKELSKSDKWSILEFHYLCQCEQFLLEELERGKNIEDRFAHVKLDSKIIPQAEAAALDVRHALGLEPHAVVENVFRCLRRLGFHVFRRRLSNSSISGLFINDADLGKCILVNYDEDIYRQRFSAAHEAAHAVLDHDEDFILSYRGSKDAKESRANYFASRFLVPPEFMRRIPDRSNWSEGKILDYAQQLRVNPEVLVYALSDQHVLDSRQKEQFRQVRIPKSQKRDPELPDNISERERGIRLRLLDSGLSTDYVGLCFDAYDVGKITAGRLAEMLLTDESGANEIAKLYGRRFRHGD